MKKLILSFLISILLGYGLYAQTYSTGNMTFLTDYSGKIDVTSTTVTVTLVGPSTSWLGVGFDATTMGGIDNGKDVIIFNGTAITDRSFSGVGVIPPVDTQNWTLVSNLNDTPSAGVRTVTMTRARVATQVTDFTFPIAAQPLDVIYARRAGSNVIDSNGHGGSTNCGFVTANLTLGDGDFVMDSLKVYPNPSKEYFTIEFPAQVDKGEIKVYDNVGKLIKHQSVSKLENKINTSDLSSGSYFMIIRTEYGNATKTLVIE